MTISRAHLLAGAVLLLAVGCGGDDDAATAGEGPSTPTASAAQTTGPATTTAAAEPGTTAAPPTESAAPASPTATFIKRADEICLAADGKEVEVLGPSPFLHAGNVVEKGPQLVRINQAKLADLHALKPPAELQTEYASFLAVHERTLDALAETVKVGADEARFDAALKELNSNRDTLDAAGDALGFTFCP